MTVDWTIWEKLGKVGKIIDTSQYLFNNLYVGEEKMIEKKYRLISSFSLDSPLYDLEDRVNAAISENPKLVPHGPPVVVMSKYADDIYCVLQSLREEGQNES